MRRLTWLWLMLLWVPLRAGAQQPVVVVDGAVGPYRQAALAARAHLEGAREVSPTSTELGAQLAQASVVVAVGQQALQAVRRSRVSHPVVFCLVLGASRRELSESVTGVPLESDPEVLFTHLKTLAPQAHRLGIIYNSTGGDLLMRRAKEAATAAGLTLVAAPVGSSAEVKGALEGLLPHIQALWLPPDPKLFDKDALALLLKESTERKLPLLGFLDSFTEQGALASVSADYAQMGERAGRLAAQVVARPEGARLPVPPPVWAPGRLTLNLRTARALGLSPPADLLSAAQHVFR